MLQVILRSQLIVALLLLATPALAQKTVPKAGTLTERQRAAIALREVRQQARPWVRPGYTLKVRPSVVPFNGDPRHPITGSGPIQVHAWLEPRKGAVGPNGKPLKPQRTISPRKYLVNVCANGTACLLEEVSNTKLARLRRGLGPVKELVHDVVSSRQALSGLSQVALSGALVNAADSDGLRGLAIGGIITGIQFVHGAIKEHNAGRRKALVDTVTWAREEGAKPSGFPHLKTAYRHYVEVLGEARPGTRPVSLKRFAEQLAAQGL